MQACWSRDGAKKLQVSGAKEQELQTPAVDNGGITDPGVNTEV